MNNNENKVMRLEVVKVDHSRFAAEILRGNAHVNMTQMAKVFGKRPADWLKTTEAQDYLRTISVMKKIVTADLVEVRQGGIPELQGTWSNDRHVAIRFAQWLSPEFAYMVDEALLRLMFGEAVFAEPINGVEPMISGGKAWYNYRDAMASFGLNRRNSAWRRKRSMPQCFCVLYGRNFITKEYFLAMKSYYEWRKQCRQLELPLDFGGEEVTL